MPALPVDLLELGSFVASYYQEPLGLVLAQMIPPLRATSRGRRRESTSPSRRCASQRAAGRASQRGSQRAPRLQALHARWLAAPDSILTIEAQAALPRVSPERGEAVARRGLRRTRLVERCAARRRRRDARPPAARLNEDQRRALAAIPLAQRKFAPFLLQGVTGSGKTEVYLAAAADAIASGGQVLILVPEINLTPQFLQRIAGALPARKAVMLHSRVSASERLRHWKAAAAGEIDVVLGTRLAVFTPLPRLALIVVDEEHDPSFKQQDGVRYHGRDVAVWRARQRGIPIVLGSATPALETLFQAQRGRYDRLKVAAARSGSPRRTARRVRSQPRCRRD